MKPVVSETETAKLLRLATFASVATASLLIAFKLFAWLLSGSVSVLASFVDSLMDVVASVINLLAVRYSLMPADEEHRFGHGKAESLAGLGQSTFIAGSAIFLMLHAVERLLHPTPLHGITVSIVVMVFSTIMTLGLLLIQRHVIKRTGSLAIKADSLHYTTDVLVNISIIIALLLAAFGKHGFDPVFGMCIAVYILYHAWHIGHEAVQMLLDRQLAPEIEKNICDIACSHKEVHGIHELRTRQSGQTQFIQLHLEIDENTALHNAHVISDEVEAAIKEIYPTADVIIHQDPVPVG